ncbi:PTS sugar transporter subunit IIA [Proteiniclasticum ruminis]|uniref:PTS system, D-glucosamine-specific IIA component/PTS system, glucose-specific IIA component n=1 Tax=Proteiniclasticum ruminis TaxID=398199 RepID=A0A1G8TH29_9CLOT|nr:PTS glucose transporter subunit IIA [Proteiniclasticum ruminis]SDJ40879.1 PTS system, D-glucosamine-specific IIA component/PTS system, glucose-specific IIA component [Proteiniclasticum ruminis]
MFGLFKKEGALVAPISGKTVDITTVPDAVFAEKMAGDGLAINPTGDTVVAPADGELTMLFGTKHAFGMTLDKGVQILVHIGLDTVSLNGEGFTALKNQGDMVKKGEPIIKIDRELIQGKGLSLITPVIFTDMDVLKSFEAQLGIDVIAGETTVLTYKAK